MRTGKVMNELRQNNKNDQLFKAVWLLVLIYFMVHPTLHNATITGLVWKVGIVLLAMITISKVRFLEKRDCALILILSASLLIGLVSAGMLFDINKWFSVIAFLNLLLFIDKSNMIKISKKAMVYLYWIAVALTALFVIFIFGGIANKVITDGRVWFCRYYVFNLDNSNIAGIYLYAFYCLILINFRSRKKQRALNVILLASLAFMIWKTEARTCIVATIFTTTLSIFYGKKSIPKAIVWTCLIFPVAFIFAYLWLFNSGFRDIAIGDKNLFSGRQETFMTYLNFIRTPLQVLFGNVGEVTFSNAHNGPLAIFCSTGLVGCATFYYVFIKRIITANQYASSSINHVAVICILGFVIQTSGEASILLGGFPGSPFICSLLLLALGNFEDDELKAT